MTNSIEFPNSIYEFLLDNSFKDTDEVYTNGSLLIPTFRVKQAIERYYKPCEDAISREAVLDLATTIETDDYSGNEILEVVEVKEIKNLPSVTPKQSFINKLCISEGVCHEDKMNVLDKIRAEIEKLNHVDCGLIYSFGARDMKEDVLGIIDKYKVESEG